MLTRDERFTSQSRRRRGNSTHTHTDACTLAYGLVGVARCRVWCRSLNISLDKYLHRLLWALGASTMCSFFHRSLFLSVFCASGLDEIANTWFVSHISVNRMENLVLVKNAHTCTPCLSQWTRMLAKKAWTCENVVRWPKKAEYRPTKNVRWFFGFLLFCLFLPFRCVCLYVFFPALFCSKPCDSLHENSLYKIMRITAKVTREDSNKMKQEHTPPESLHDAILMYFAWSHVSPVLFYVVMRSLRSSVFRVCCYTESWNWYD